MVEDIVLYTFPKEAGAYLFKIDNEVIYVGSSNNIYLRMVNHKSCIRKGGDHGYKQDLYQYLQSNPFTVEFYLTDVYRQLEQELVEKYHPRYNSYRAYTGLVWNGNKVEYEKQRYRKYKEEILEQNKKYSKQYDNQLCYYNGQTLTLNALRKRFRRKGITNPTKEAKKYIKKESKKPIEFYDIYP